MTWKGIIADYRALRGCRVQELGPFRKLDFGTALRRAALAQRADGGRFDHQRRIKRVALNAALRAMTAASLSLRRARNFDHLHRIIRELTRPIPGIGKLYLYDTALRLGANLGFLPTKVYLHAGTRVGAARLGLESNCCALSRSAFPAPLAKLPAYQIEDILCIYKNRF